MSAAIRHSIVFTFIFIGYSIIFAFMSHYLLGPLYGSHSHLYICFTLNKRCVMFQRVTCIWYCSYRHFQTFIDIYLHITSLITWWRHQMEAFSALLALYARNSPVTGEFPSQRPVTRSFDVFFELRLNKRLRNNREAGDLRRHRAHYDVTLMWAFDDTGCIHINMLLHSTIYALCLNLHWASDKIPVDITMIFINSWYLHQLIYIHTSILSCLHPYLSIS